MNRLLLAVLAAGSFTFANAVLAAGAEERLAREYLEALTRADLQRMVSFYHPNEITELRARVLAAIEREAAAGGDAIRTRIFGVVTSVGEVRRLTPQNLYLELAGRMSRRAQPVKQIKVLGVVGEGAEQAHVVARLVPAEADTRERLSLVTLLRHGKGWRVALPGGFQAQVDAWLAEPPQAAPAEPVAVSNTAGIEALLDVSIDLLRTGECAAYFNERMSPQFRANTSAQALKRLIAQCERSVDTREIYIAALRIARGSAPRYEENGTRAVYDLSGKGLPFQRFVLERIENRWYVAE